LASGDGCAQPASAQPASSSPRNRLEIVHELRHALRDGLGVGIQHHLGVRRCLVGRRNPGEFGDFTRPRLLIEALRVAVLAGLEAGIDQHLDEISLTHDRADVVAVGPVGRDERREDDDAGIREELRHLTDPADVLAAVVGREAEVRIQAVADVVAVEHVGEPPSLDEGVLGRDRDRRLPRAGKTGQPDRHALLAEHFFAIVPRDVTLVPRDVRALALRQDVLFLPISGRRP
jgi:hypothetical protein